MTFGISWVSLDSRWQISSTDLRDGASQIPNYWGALVHNMAICTWSGSVTYRNASQNQNIKFHLTGYEARQVFSHSEIHSPQWQQALQEERGAWSWPSVQVETIFDRTNHQFPISLHSLLRSFSRRDDYWLGLPACEEIYWILHIFCHGFYNETGRIMSARVSVIVSQKMLCYSLQYLTD